MSTILEPRFKHTIIVLLEGRSYSHLFGDNSYKNLEEESRPDLWPQEVLEGDYSSVPEYKRCHTKKTLPVIQTLHKHYASIPYLTYEKVESDENDATQYLSNIKQLFGENAYYVEKIYTYVPSVVGTLNQKSVQATFNQFFADVQNEELPLISVIESNTYMDGQGWSMATGGNSLNYSEEKILDIYHAITHSQKYKDNTNILFVWMTDGYLPDNSPTKRLANIWVSPYFEIGQKIYNKKNYNITLKSINTFLQMQYARSFGEEDKENGKIWQTNFISEKKINREYLFRELKANKTSYNAGSAPFKLGHTKRITGTAEKIYQEMYFEKMSTSDVENTVNLEDHYSTIKLEETGLKIKKMEDDDSNSTAGFWLIFTAIVLWFLLLFGLFYVYMKKYIWQPRAEEKMSF